MASLFHGYTMTPSHAGSVPVPLSRPQYRTGTYSCILWQGIPRRNKHCKEITLSILDAHYNPNDSQQRRIESMDDGHPIPTADEVWAIRKAIAEWDAQHSQDSIPLEPTRANTRARKGRASRMKPTSSGPTSVPPNFPVTIDLTRDGNCSRGLLSPPRTPSPPPSPKAPAFVKERISSIRLNIQRSQDLNHDKSCRWLAEFKCWPPARQAEWSRQFWPSDDAAWKQFSAMVEKYQSLDAARFDLLPRRDLTEEETEEQKRRGMGELEMTDADADGEEDDFGALAAAVTFDAGSKAPMDEDEEDGDFAAMEAAFLATLEAQRSESTTALPEVEEFFSLPSGSVTQIPGASPPHFEEMDDSNEEPLRYSPLVIVDPDEEV